MDDVISRQQAIVTAVNAAINWHKLANPQYSIAYCIGEAMRQLPSALGTNLAEDGTDCISRQAAIDAIMGEYPEVHYPDWYAHIIKQLPPAKPTFDARDTQYNLPIGTDLISRAVAQTELQLSARRYTVAHEAHGEGRVVWSEDLISVSDAMNVLRKLPSAQPKPKRGRWERHYSRPNVYADLFWHCSECGYKDSENYAPVYHHFCPNCGAKMEVTT